MRTADGAYGLNFGWIDEFERLLVLIVGGLLAKQRCAVHVLTLLKRVCGGGHHCASLRHVVDERSLNVGRVIVVAHLKLVRYAQTKLYFALEQREHVVVLTNHRIVGLQQNRFTAAQVVKVPYDVRRVL